MGTADGKQINFLENRKVNIFLEIVEQMRIVFQEQRKISRFPISALTFFF